MTTVHSFEIDLAFSEAPESSAFFEQVYFRFWGQEFVQRIPVPGNTPAQRMGVDCLIYLWDDRIIRVDEKLRTANYNDVALEHTSNTRTKAPGWMEKSLHAEYIAYGILPINKAFMFPWPLLRRAWITNKAAWKKAYQDVVAINDGYETLSTPVPLGILFAALNAATIVNLPNGATKP